MNKAHISLYNREFQKNKLEKDSTKLIHKKEKMKEEIELVIDFKYEHLIEINDDEVEKNELNNVPYKQALRIDKRSIYQILISVFINEIGFLNMLLYRNPYSHLSLIIMVN